MKYLKLSFIFGFFIGAIYLIINWGSIFPPANQDSEYADKDKLNITEECEKIRKGWSEVTEWDESLYKKQRADIDQSKAMGLFSKEGYNTVNNTLRETATNKACDAYFNELKKGEAFQHDNLVKHYNGVKTIMEAEELDDDPRITHVKEVNQLYNRIRAFVNSDHRIRPAFDEEKTDWKSFAMLQSNIIATANSYKNNKLYSEVKLVPGFASGLNDAQLKQMTDPQRAKFYNDLCKQIIAYFSKVEATQANYNLFNQIYKNFAREDSDHGLDELAEALVDFKSKISK